MSFKATRHSILLLLFMGFHLITNGQIRRALKLLKEHDFQRLELHLNKSLEKDSVNAFANYISSVLWTTEAYQKKNIDSAYQSILEAQHDYSISKKRDKLQMGRSGINDSSISVQIEYVEVLAYQRSTQINSIKSYTFFIENFSRAAELDEAIGIRNNLAFEKAKALHSYESYKYFMDTYPEAEQVSKAKELFDIRLYEEKTVKGRLIDYQQFMKEYPQSPYLNIAEKNIYQFITSDNQASSYTKFLKEHPNGYYQKRATDFLFHKYIANHTPSKFLSSYPLQTTDSLKQVLRLLGTVHIPYYDLNGYGLMDLRGNVIVPAKFKTIDQKMLCGVSDADYFITGKGERKMLVGLNGEVIYQGAFEGITDVGFGVLQIDLANSLALIQKGGHPILKGKIQEVKILSGAFIACKKRRGWGLYTFSGRALLGHRYKSIHSEGSLFVFNKNEKLAIIVLSELAKGLVNPVNLQHIYEDIEFMDENEIVLVSKGNETLINSKLETLIQGKKQTIKPIEDGYLLKADNSFQLSSRKYPNLSNQKFEEVIIKEKRIIVKQDGKWALVSNGKTGPKFVYDSITLVGESFNLLHQNGEKWFSFLRTKKLVKEDGTFKLLRSSKTGAEYLQFGFKNGTIEIVNAVGRTILKGKFDKVTPLGTEYLVVDSEGKRGLFSASGKRLLKNKYSAIGNYHDGIVSLLENGNFGAYSKSKDISIKALFEKPVQALSDRFFVVSQNEKVGLVDKQRNELLPIEYDEILFWNSQSVLARQNFQWTIVLVANSKTVIEGIKSFSYIRNTDKEIILKIHTAKGFGLLSNQRGSIITATYSDIINLGTEDEALYFCEKQIEEANFYVVIYVNEAGKIIRKQAFEEEDYGMILCDRLY